MKKRNNRFLAGTLAGLMMLTMLPVTALAAQEGADGDAASDTPNNNIVNVVNDGENGQQAVNNDVNIAANSGNENAQKSADDSENAQESADDSSGGSADTAAPAPQEGEAGGSGQIRLRRQSRLLRRLGLRRMKLWIKLSKLYRVTKLLRLARIAR